MSVFDRPYAGNWAANRRKVTRYTPDAILLLNGDTTVPGHKPEKKVIDIQRYVTQMSCDSGVESGSASASFTLSIPKDIGSSLFSDGHSVFQPGLEVHIYMRGYFPVKGLANTLNQEELKALRDVLGNPSADLAMRPYYHCFHGVTTTANLEYSGGFYSINQSCTGMLHFWQYHDISTNASLFGTRPTGSKLKMSLVGHNFTNMSPFSIIYSLYKDTAGAAGGVAFALSASSNQSKKFFAEDKSLFEMTQLYWEKRFQSKMYNLRMFGVNGEQLNSAQTAMIGRMSSSQLRAAAEINMRHRNNTRTGPSNPNRYDLSQIRNQTHTNREFTLGSFSRAMLQYLERAGEGSGYAVSAAQLKAFVNDIGQWGNVNLFESSYTSKLDIASAASTAVGYEFYQDVDGDLVFKPPLYNLDTKGLEAYRIEPEDVISITRASAEPQCTYMTVKSGQFSNWKGLGLEGEWGIRGQYIDYRLVAKYGWRPGDFDAQFYSDARGAFWAAVARMDVINEAMETANITIPLRPELRPGFPVYVRHLDCYYYVKSMSHSFSYGGQCTTTLQCVAQRKKFLPPGVAIGAMGSTATWGSNGITHVTLSRPDNPTVPLVQEDGAGGVKQVGFPNVVMALDPDAISPLAWAFGQDFIDLSNPQSIKNVLMALAGIGSNATLTVTDIPNLGPPLAIQSNAGNTDQSRIEAFFDGTANAGSFSVAVPDAFATDGRPTAWIYKQLSFANLRNQIRGYQEFLKDQTLDDRQKAEASVAGTEAFEAAAERYQTELRNAGIDTRASATEATIFDLFKLVGYFQVRDQPALNSASILELLADKKANFSNASTPGYYRYFSSSHPNQEDQAPNELTARNVAQGLVYEPKNRTMANYASGQFRSGGLIPPTSISSSPALTSRYVEYDTSGTHGDVRVFTVAGSGGSQMELPSSDIYTLMFSKGTVQLNALVQDGQAAPAFTGNDIRNFYVSAIEGHLSSTIGTIPIDATLSDAYSGFIEGLANIKFPEFVVLGGQPVDNVVRRQGSTRDNPLSIDARFVPFQWSNNLAGTGAYRLDRADAPLGEALGDRKLIEVPLFLNCARCRCYSGTAAGGRRNSPQNGSNLRGSVTSLDPRFFDAKVVSNRLHRIVANKLTRRVFALLTESVVQWNRLYPNATARDTDEAKEAWLALAKFSNEFNGYIGYSDSRRNLNRHFRWGRAYNARANYRKPTSVMSPIFPVSDAGGYKHFGSYAYGRGVSLNTQRPGWQRLVSQDPLEELDGKTVDAFVREILRSGSDDLVASVFRNTDAGNTNDKHIMVAAVLQLQRDDPAAYARTLRKMYVPDQVEKRKDITLAEYKSKYNPSKDQEAEMIAYGLINHFMRDDTPGLHTNPINSAHNLVDIMPEVSGAKPTAHDEILWDSMVKMNVGDPNSFLYVAPQGDDGDLLDNVTKQVKNQMFVSASPHAEYQAELRGKRELPRESVDFQNMFSEWGAGKAAWETTAAGSAFEKLSQVFRGETPDDPELKAAYQRLSDLKNSFENIPDQYKKPEGQTDAGSDAGQEPTPDTDGEG